MALVISPLFGATAAVYADTNNAGAYPWSKVLATGDYIADTYEEVPSGHVFESVTQERLLDILSSNGNYYIVFGGPRQATSQKVLEAINQQAKTDGITKIYHFDPYIDGYQVDITKSTTTWKANNGRYVYELWTRITALLPEGPPISDYDSSDTLLFLYNRESGNSGSIRAYYSFKSENMETYDINVEKDKIERVFRGNNLASSEDTVVANNVRNDFAFFSRVYNAGASKIEGTVPSVSRIGASVTLFDGLTSANFKLHQINFVELQNLYNTPGEHIILYGASWCHNTQAIIGSVAKAAATSSSVNVVYVYDTTVGNQQTYGTGTNIDVSTAVSTDFNSRNNISLTNLNNNISYMYGEAVKPLGDFITEDNSLKQASIYYYPNGDLSGDIPTANPWEDTIAEKKAIRLQMPFLLSYDNSKAKPVTKQWLHKQTNGTYLEYMLELAWVRATDLAKSDTGIYRNTGQTKVGFAEEGISAIKTFFGDSSDDDKDKDKDKDKEKEKDKGKDKGNGESGEGGGGSNGGGDENGGSGENTDTDNIGSTATQTQGSGGTVARTTAKATVAKAAAKKTPTVVPKASALDEDIENSIADISVPEGTNAVEYASLSELFKNGVPPQIAVAVALVLLVIAGMVLDKKGILLRRKAVKA